MKMNGGCGMDGLAEGGKMLKVELGGDVDVVVVLEAELGRNVDVIVELEDVLITLVKVAEGFELVLMVGVALDDMLEVVVPLDVAVEVVAGMEDFMVDERSEEGEIVLADPIGRTWMT